MLTPGTVLDLLPAAGHQEPFDFVCEACGLRRRSDAEQAWVRAAEGQEPRHWCRACVLWRTRVLDGRRVAVDSRWAADWADRFR